MTAIDTATFERDYLPHAPADLQTLYWATDDEARAKMRPRIFSALGKTAELRTLLDGLRARTDAAARGAGEA